MLHIMDVMGMVFTYVEVTLYHTFLFIAIFPMPIHDMHHVDVFVTLECIHPYFLCIVTRCLFRDVFESCHAPDVPIRKFL